MQSIFFPQRYNVVFDLLTLRLLPPPPRLLLSIVFGRLGLLAVSSVSLHRLCICTALLLRRFSSSQPRNLTRLGGRGLISLTLYMLSVVVVGRSTLTSSSSSGLLDRVRKGKSGSVRESLDCADVLREREMPCCAKPGSSAIGGGGEPSDSIRRGVIYARSSMVLRVAIG